MSADNPKTLIEIQPKQPLAAFSAQHVIAGVPISKTSRIGLFSPVDWEAFVEEWASSLKKKYVTVGRLAGAGDQGIDIAAFHKTPQFSDGWDNYQCKHYQNALAPSQAWIEIAKIIYWSHLGVYPSPNKYFFVAPKGIGTTLSKLLSDAQKLKSECEKNWDQYCRYEVAGKKSDTPLAGALKTHFDKFDFSIFTSISTVGLIEQHATTPFHAIRFGGGLQPRAKSEKPPVEIHAKESRYIEQLFFVYSEVSHKKLDSAASLDSVPEYSVDFQRQRERFYSAEALKTFARDNVPGGTFEALQHETLHAVIDTCDDLSHPNGLTRMRKTLDRALNISFAASPLFSVVNSLDKQGMCHQLANEDQLLWLKK